MEYAAAMAGRGTDGGPPTHLPALIIPFFAVVAETILVRPISPFVRRNVAPGRARTVVVINALVGWLLGFVDRVKVWYFRHRK